MISIARFWLSILLMLLQLAAPLIHAHKNGSDFDGVFHLPEFEQINLLLDQNTSFFVATTQNDEIVTVGTAIKVKFQTLKNEPLNSFVLTLFFITVTRNSLRQLLNQIAPQTNFRFFNLSAPRAPPVFLFR
ncbi:MAG: hypothetical protein WCL34_08110 [Methylococcaceae bacterium]|jgi:hypothetical protein